MTPFNEPIGNTMFNIIPIIIFIGFVATIGLIIFNIL